MNLDYAVERLYQTGWTPADTRDALELTPLGRAFPGVATIQREFAGAGLNLAIKHNVMFNCYRATWSPAEGISGAPRRDDACRGTVVGACEREAAVYALAQFRAAATSQVESPLATA